MKKKQKKQTRFIKIDFKTGMVGEENDWGGDLFGLLAEAKVELILEVERAVTHGGTSRYGRGVRQIHTNVVPKKWNDQIAETWATLYRAELRKTGDSQTAAEVASQEVR